MKMLGGIRLGEGSSIGNITLPSGETFPEGENEGELFYLKGNPTLPSGLYLCEEGKESELEWRLILHIYSDELRTRLVELGSTDPVHIFSARDVAVRWNYQASVDTKTFEHSLVSEESTKIRVKLSGFYQISYTMNSSQDKKSGEQMVKCSIRINGSQTVGRSVTNALSQGAQYPTTNTSTIVIRLDADDYVELIAKSTSAKGKTYEMFTVEKNCGIAITRLGDLK